MCAIFMIMEYFQLYSYYEGECEQRVWYLWQKNEIVTFCCFQETSFNNIANLSSILCSEENVNRPSILNDIK